MVQYWFMENLAFNFIYGSNADLEPFLVPISFILGSVIAAIFWKTNAKINRSTFFLYFGFLTFAAALSNLPWLLIWEALENNILWLLIFFQIILLIGIGGLYAVAAKQRSIEAFGSSRYAVLAFIPIINIYFMLKRSKESYSPISDSKVSSLNIFGGLLALVCAVGMNGSLETSLAKEMQPDAQQKVLISSQLAEHLSLEVYMNNYVLPDLSVPLKLDEYNTIIELKVLGDRVVNTIRHDSDYPPVNTEPFVSNVKEFMCQRWSWLISDTIDVDYLFVDLQDQELLTVTIGAKDCVK